MASESAVEVENLLAEPEPGQLVLQISPVRQMVVAERALAERLVP